MQQLRELLPHFEQNNTCTQHVTNHALNRDKTNHVNMTCTSYDTIPKREYGLLLRQMENWGIVAPKAIVKKYGVFLVRRAVDYTKATPNVKNPAGYMTYMLQQFRKDMEQPQKVENPKPQQELLKENAKEVQIMPKEIKTPQKLTQMPQINNWVEARKFVADFYDGTYKEDDNLLEFVSKIKRQYNFA